jgi:hypothetical protein
MLYSVYRPVSCVQNIDNVIMNLGVFRRTGMLTAENRHSPRSYIGVIVLRLFTFLSPRWGRLPHATNNVRRPFAKFVDSPYYSESELRGGAVTVCLSKYLPWQAVHFLRRSTHFSKTCCRPLITSKFLASELRFHG